MHRQAKARAALSGLTLSEFALQALPVNRHPEAPLIPRLWELRHDLSAYDAAYVALAEALRCPLLTFDASLVGAPELPVRIELLDRSP